MQASQFILFYVQSPEASARFYEGLLKKTPVESSPGFALFAFDSGLMLGLWARSEVAPAPEAGPGAGELAFPVDGPAEVDRLHAQWQALGVRIGQAPVGMDFGYTFLGMDPDGHRLRVFAPADPAAVAAGSA